MISKLTLAILLLLATLAFAQTNITPQVDYTLGATATEVCTTYNALRYACSCTNTDATIHMRWGNSAVTTTSGQQVRAGASVEIRSRAKIYFIAESGTPVLSCTEESR